MSSPVLFEQYTSYSVSVSAVEILFPTKMAMIKQECSWHRVRYYLEVAINSDFL